MAVTQENQTNIRFKIFLASAGLATLIHYSFHIITSHMFDVQKFAVLCYKVQVNKKSLCSLLKDV